VLGATGYTMKKTFDGVESVYEWSHKHDIQKEIIAAQENLSLGLPTKIKTDTTYVNDRGETVTSIVKAVPSKQFIASKTHELKQNYDPSFLEACPENVALPLFAGIIALSAGVKLGEWLEDFGENVADTTAGWHLAIKKQFAKKPKDNQAGTAP
jgi:hypothetical protein